MAAQPSTVKVIDQFQVAPPPGSVSTTIVPLTFYDIVWFCCCPVQQIFFYEFPHPTLHFTQNVLPHLKESLSQTLRHFFPFAGNLTCPPPPHVPYILFNEGDAAAVQVVVTESDADFNHLVVGKHARDVKTLKSLVQKLLFIRPSSSNTTHVAPVMAIQFTVFANSGISVGVTSNHVAADGRSINHFMKFWASIHKSPLQGDQGLITSSSLSLPYCSKDIIQDPNGFSSIILKDIQSLGDSGLSGDVADHDERVQITLTLKRAEIDELKHCVKTTQSKSNELYHDQQIHISSFAVTCAFTWVNLMKLHEKINGSSDDNVVYHFLAQVDCRERLLSEIPATYFGNCLTTILVPAKRKDLMGESGIVFAAKAIGRKINELGKVGVLEGFDNAISKINQAFQRSIVVTVASSPKFQVYNTDFGWGRPRKFDLVHIDAYRCFSIAESRDDDGGLDIGIVVERDRMDIFNAIFEQHS
ncbi:hypothetical protein Dsin_029776 [Dipteronia sinensis]|uniref:Uncharacterized protein n=1 Tax=Dipteronia sinensis TaxID=43782 RepID=A0AAD9ZT63_9ROSI|nr:hypothetical protein Dsin_029776 [Dipteronia sinensis]